MTNLKKIIEFLEKNKILYEFYGDMEMEITSFCPLNRLQENCITWVRHIKDVPVSTMNEMRHIVLVAELGKKVNGAEFPVIYVSEPHRTYFKILTEFFGEQDPEQRESMIAETAVVETENTGSDLYVGHHTYISKEAVLGNHVRILNHVTIQGRVIIGDYTVIESGVTIGACGFGHYTDENGNPVCVPHFGGVKIGEHVRIGANSVVSRGCLADTIIEDYVKIDNLCNISHNDYIKRGAMIAAGTMVSGSTTVGEKVWLAPGTVLNNAIEIGDGSYLGLGAVAIRNVKKGKVMFGVPARVLHDRRED